MKLVFMGTPDFAVSALSALIEAGHQVAAAVTQPDKPKGRGKAVIMPPVKEKAMEYGIPVYQPDRISTDEEFYELLTGIKPDAIVVAAFGQLLPERILSLPRYGCINVHASLLPRYRGAAPIQRAVIDGEQETGITTMFMDIGLDTGDILEQMTVALDEAETGKSLFDKLSKAGGILIVSTLKKLEDQTAVRKKQDETQATYAKMLSKSSGRIDWRQDAGTIERLVRGLNPWPSAYTLCKGRTLKLWAAGVVPDAAAVKAEFPDMDMERDKTFTAGTVAYVGKDNFLVQTGNGFLNVREVQLEGKKRMDAGSFLRGSHLEQGTLLG